MNRFENSSLDPECKVTINGLLHRVIKNRVSYWNGSEWIRSTKPCEFIRKQYVTSLKKPYKVKKGGKMITITPKPEDYSF